MNKYNSGVIIINMLNCDKARVTKGKYTVNYDLDGETVIPLQFGDGTYTVEILRNVEKNKYAVVQKKTITATDTISYLLQENCYVPDVPGAYDYSAKTLYRENAKDAYNTVTEWARTHLIYDWIKAATVPKKGVAPDPEGCWETKRGICQDIASLVTGMLRAAGVPARMVIGLANGKSHAWVEALIDGKWKRFDHSGTAKSYQRQRWY